MFLWSAAPFPRPIAAAALLLGTLAPGAAEAQPAPATPPAPVSTPAAPPATNGPREAALYRIFLRHGEPLVSYGEFAQVADQVIASIPIGGSETEPTLHVVTIPAADVDWERTNLYTDAIRAKHFLETRAEAEFSAMSRDVASMLNQVSTKPTPAERLALAEAARRQLIEWPQQHYGYRATDVSQMVTWLDQVVSELRIAAGQTAFDLAFVAGPTPVQTLIPAMPPPTLRERIELALSTTSHLSEPAERVALLRAVVAALPSVSSDAWAAGVRARAVSAIAAEEQTDRQYADLTARVLARADSQRVRHDVRALEALASTVLAEDARLNRARPAQVSALLSTLDQRIDAARRLRLARDAWLLRNAMIRQYWRDVRLGLDQLLGVREWLTDVRQLAGPAPRSLDRLIVSAGDAARALGGVRPPDEVAAAHATLQSAAALATRAAAMRRDALRASSMDMAWQASSAAAGALMLLDQAVDDLRRITRAPGPR